MAKNNQNPEIKQAEESSKTAIVKKSRHIIRWIVVATIAVFGCYAFLLYQTQQSATQEQQQSSDNLHKSLDEKIAQITSRVSVLENELNRLKMADGNSEKIESLRADIETKLLLQEEKIAESIKVWNEESPSQPLKFMDKETRIEKELLLAMGTMVIRDLAEREFPFAYEAEVLRVMAQGNESAEKYVDTMQKYATSGIKGKKMLISEFNGLYPHLSIKEEPVLPEETKTEKKDLPWWEEVGETILQWTKNLFSSKKTAELPVLESKTDKVYELVNEGDLATALNELNTNDAYAKLMNDPLRQWIYQVRLYLDFEKAVNGLLMNSLANLHLKEMEH